MPRLAAAAHLIDESLSHRRAVTNRKLAPWYGRIAVEIGEAGCFALAAA